MSVPNKDLFSLIFSTLEGNEPLGVNQIGRVIDAAPSSCLRVLKSRKGQRVFSQLDSKKWTTKGSPYTVDEWPLGPNEEEVNERIQQWIDSPLEHVQAIQEERKYYKDFITLASKREQFLFRLLEHAIRSK